MGIGVVCPILMMRRYTRHSKPIKQFIFGCFTPTTLNIKAQFQNVNVLNDALEISKNFNDYKNTYYLVDEQKFFNPEIGQVFIKNLYSNLATRETLNHILNNLIPLSLINFQ